METTMAPPASNTERRINAEIRSNFVMASSLDPSSRGTLDRLQDDMSVPQRHLGPRGSSDFGAPSFSCRGGMPRPSSASRYTVSTSRHLLFDLWSLMDLLFQGCRDRRVVFRRHPPPILPRDRSGPVAHPGERYSTALREPAAEMRTVKPSRRAVRKATACRDAFDRVDLPSDIRVKRCFMA